MKKFLLYSFIAILLCGIFVPHFIGVQAQANGGAANGPSTGTSVLNGIGNLAVGNIFGAAQNFSNAASIDPISWVLSAVLTISQLLLTITSWLVWLSGMLLNYVITYTVLNMTGNIVSMSGINIVWKVGRDIMNMFFIFILLYNAIQIIISQKSKENIKEIVTGIVITLLLVNFSLFFTKVIIDASNVLTIGMYDNIANAGQAVQFNGNKIDVGISGAFVDQMKISSLYDQGILNQVGNSTPDQKKTLTIVSLGGSAVLLVLSFVFLAMAAMFAIRYVAFIILLMFSFLGFIGWGLPKLKDLQSEWWDTLMSQCIFAPYFMFWMWAILTLITSPGFINLTGAISNSGTSSTGTSFVSLAGNNGVANANGLGLVVNFGIVIALIIIALVQTKKQSSKGSSYITAATGHLTEVAGGTLFGSSAWLSRQTAGRYGARIANDKDLQATADRGGIRGYIAQKAINTGQKVASGSHDVRRSAIGEQISKSTGTNFGTGLPFKPDAGKGGMTAERKGEKDRAETAKKDAKTRQKEKVKADLIKMVDDLASGKPTSLINPATGLPYATLIQGLAALPSDCAKKLKPATLKNPSVIRQLSVRHLRDIISGDPDDDVVNAIVTVVAPYNTAVPPVRVAGPHPQALNQFTYMMNPSVRYLWGI